MEILFAPMVPFIFFPWTALAPALFFCVLCVRQRSGRGGQGKVPDRVAWILAALAWAAYGLYESWVHTQEPVPSIRVDLLVIVPLLYWVTGTGFMRWRRARRREAGDPVPG